MKRLLNNLVESIKKGLQASETTAKARSCRPRLEAMEERMALDSSWGQMAGWDPYARQLTMQEFQQGWLNPIDKALFGNYRTPNYAQVPQARSWGGPISLVSNENPLANVTGSGAFGFRPVYNSPSPYRVAPSNQFAGMIGGLNFAPGMGSGYGTGYGSYPPYGLGSSNSYGGLLGSAFRGFGF